MCNSKTRPYRMRRRAEQVAQTRQRITEAAARLHTTVGPAHTSLAGVAEEAGVTRLTVYRHFRDLDELFVACRAHWASQHPPPTAEAWGTIANLEDRARVAFAQLYGWYRLNVQGLYPIYRDIGAIPDSARQAMIDQEQWIADSVLGADARPGRGGRPLRALAGHLVSFRTWHSLANDQGLDDQEVVDLAVRLLTGEAGSGPTDP